MLTPNYMPFCETIPRNRTVLVLPAEESCNEAKSTIRSEKKKPKPKREKKKLSTKKPNNEKLQPDHTSVHSDELE